ncbi:Pyridoxamine 5'-phosphate oxidase [Paraburkholderia tropica]|uniref:pyridoxamine 5'-phosphate oxidase family protein n=1 Tax=Paraburkholderia tropica TaxID=92647 RepID=UPI001CB33156|nr:pyridoxamine 5'-phosphate oxidase family protein [Paraburkholderia tropica]CAG9224044.1 Pyridoxamine 5'-phosphate oxidase [Paraburkholderia tropica]
MASTVHRYSSDIAFTPTVKAMQSRLGSREIYARVEAQRGFGTDLTPDVQAFIEAQRSVFLATANAEGQPYIQHRGGPPGFLRVLDARTIAFADFIGNQQYITLGNLTDNAKAYLFLIDYAHRRRVKVWGEARVVDDDAALVERLMPPGYKARAERAIVFTVTAWDMNCPQHIPQRFEAADVKAALEERDARIRELEAEVAKLRAQH